MSTSTDRTPPKRRDSRFLLLPAATFLVGLLLGGVLVWVGGSLGEPDDVEDRIEAGAEETEGAGSGPTPDESATDVTVTVPAECVEAAETAQQILDLARQAASAIADLDAQELQAIVDDMEALEPQIRSSAGACQDRAET